MNARAAAEAERLEFEKRRKAALARATIELDTTDVRIIEHLVLRPWLTQEAIGDLVGLSRQSVNERVNAPKFQRAIAESAKSALQIFESNKAKAARKLGLLLDSIDDRVAIRAAIAHMWPHIHAEGGKTGDEDFVSLLKEAADKAEREELERKGGTK